MSGQLLLSMPGIGDPRFERAVIAICAHDEDSALGIIVNHIYEGMTVRAMMEQLDIDPGVTPADAPVYAGGPVEPERGFVLHTPDYGGQGTLHVGNSWALTATMDVLRDIAAGKGPRRWLVALGYTGWGEGQLDTELTRHGWMHLPGTPEILFDMPLAERWPRSFAALGVDVSHLSSTAGRA